MIYDRLLILAAGIDVGALSALIMGDPGPLQVVLLLGSHALACAGFALAGMKLLPPQYRISPWRALTLFFSLCFFIPAVSVLGIALAVILSRLVKAQRSFEPYGQVEPPSYRSGLQAKQRGYAAGGIKALMLNPRAQVDVRLRALLTTQAMPRRMANPLLHQALSGDVDDIRLLAYGILSNQEQEISEHIHRLRQEEPADAAARLKRDHMLAQLHWELVHNELVLGDMRRHTLADAERLVLSCLDKSPEDAGLWLLLGKIRLASGQPEMARPCFMAAQSFGQAPTNVIPFLAELAWRQRRYHDIRSLMAQLPASGLPPQIHAMRRYWADTPTT
ncbi:hypothetical protein [Chitinimonas sp. BJYL2]|uniref:hypothetical protein n=1 Tax=Chitinimonas sp. BJYL2 TaxID=2976696 RepID=UPI0022B3B38C|nr:hypothetical protein [Chitinimonas sp. BJYL2]